MLTNYDTLFDRPVIILAAPRSGSTLLFETLAEAPQIWTVGGESHQFIEGLRPLNPMSGQVDSNRLDASHATGRIEQVLRRRFAQSLQDRDGRPLSPEQLPERLRFLEKTPKNALRQPFLEKVFPGAFYVHLVRDPRPNISSMMEAWKSGRWVTYPRLPGWRGPPWSLLLPPGWQGLRGCSLAEICAFQWDSANRVILDDLEKLPPERWLACQYDDLTQRTEPLIRKICEFAGLDLDDRLVQHISGALPLSRLTQTAPDPEKWRKNETVILPVLGSVDETWQRCGQVLRRFPVGVQGG
jgi:hypothetical protein